MKRGPRVRRLHIAFVANYVGTARRDVSRQLRSKAALGIARATALR